MAGFVATVANAPYKKEVKPEKLYKPQLLPAKKPERESTPEDAAAAKRNLKEYVESLVREVK